MRVKNFGIYGILTDPLVGYERLAEIMVEKEVPYIQLRMKEAPRKEILQVAKRLRSIIPPKIKFIINDDPSLALEAGADGVHLGQEDLPYDQARQMLGPEALIGLSTHNPSQTRRACTLMPDLIGVGPVFATPTKKKPDPEIGLAGMQEMLALATVPAVVLGSIDLVNLPRIIKSGARNICAVRCVNHAADPGAVLEQMWRALSAIDEGNPCRSK